MTNPDTDFAALAGEAAKGSEIFQKLPSEQQQFFQQRMGDLFSEVATTFRGRWNREVYIDILEEADRPKGGEKLGPLSFLKRDLVDQGVVSSRMATNLLGSVFRNLVNMQAAGYTTYDELMSKKGSR